MSDTSVCFTRPGDFLVNRAYRARKFSTPYPPAGDGDSLRFPPSLIFLSRRLRVYIPVARVRAPRPPPTPPCHNIGHFRIPGILVGALDKADSPTIRLIGRRNRNPHIYFDRNHNPFGKTVFSNGRHVSGIGTPK